MHYLQLFVERSTDWLVHVIVCIAQKHELNLSVFSFGISTLVDVSRTISVASSLCDFYSITFLLFYGGQTTPFRKNYFQKICLFYGFKKKQMGIYKIFDFLT